MKASDKLEFGQVPMLELDDGTRLCHGDAIFNYVCNTVGKDVLQTSDDALKIYQAEATMVFHNDDFVKKHIVAAFFKPEEAKAAHFAEITEKHLPGYLAHMERRLPKDGFLLGEKLSKYDIQLATFFGHMFAQVDETKISPWNKSVMDIIVANHPNVHAYAKRVVGGELKEYFANRKQCPF